MNVHCEFQKRRVLLFGVKQPVGVYYIELMDGAAELTSAPPSLPAGAVHADRWVSRSPAAIMDLSSSLGDSIFFCLRQFDALRFGAYVLRIVKSLSVCSGLYL